MLLILVLAFFSPELFFGRSFSGSDTVNYTEPMTSFVHESLKKGEFPLWNPYLYGGFPVFAESNTGTAYPLNLLFSVFPAFKAITYSAALHFFLAGIFMMFYAFCFTQDAAAVFLAMAVWVFSGMFSYRIDHMTVLQAMAYIPLFLFSIEKYSLSSNRLWLFLTAVSVTLTILIGHGQTAFYMLAAGCVYYPARVLMRKKKIVSPDTLFFGASMLLGVAMAALQAIPTYEMISFTARNSGMPQDAILGSETITWMNILNMAFPFLFGSVNNNTYIGIYIFKSWFISYIMLYTGAASLFLSFLAARRLKKEPVAALFASFMAFAFLFAMGKNFPLNYFAVKLPVLNKFRNPAMMLEYYVFFTAALSAYMAGSLRKEDVSVRFMKASVIISGAMTASAGLIFIFKGRILGIFSGRVGAFINRSVVNSMFHHYPAEYYTDKFVNTVSFISGGVLVQAVFITLLCLLFLAFAAGSISKQKFSALLVFLACTELFANMAGYQPVQKDAFYAATPSSAAELVKDGSHRILQWRYFENESLVFKKGEARGGLEEHLRNREALRPNQNVRYGVFSIAGYSPIATKKYYDYCSPFEKASIEGGGDKDPVISQGKNVLDAGAVKYILSPYEITGVKGLKKTGKCGNLTIFEREGAPGMASFVPNAVFINDDKKIFETLGDPSFDMKNLCIISSEKNGVENNGGASAPANITKWEGGHISFELKAPSNGYAVISSAYYPGWTASVDKKPAKILNANYVFSAVKLAPGIHVVEMDFKPASFRLGMLVSAISFLIFFVALCAEIITGKKRRAESIVS